MKKARIMSAFKDGLHQPAVATTVIRSGGSPNATLMVIEHAERIGLAQLHQLRARIAAAPRTTLHPALPASR